MTRYGHWDGRCTFRGVQPLGTATVLRVVVHEHVVGDGHQRTVDGHLVGNHDLLDWMEDDFCHLAVRAEHRMVKRLNSPEIVACRADCRRSSGNSGCI